MPDIKLIPSAFVPSTQASFPVVCPDVCGASSGLGLRLSHLLSFRVSPVLLIDIRALCPRSGPVLLHPFRDLPLLVWFSSFRLLDL